MAAIWTQNLLKLQTLDLEIRNLKLRMTMIPKEANAVKAQVAAVEAKVKAARELRQSHERELKQNEADASGLADKIRKLEQQSGLVKKNTEYQAMMDSIAMLKKAIGDLETRALELMDLIEGDAGKIRAAEEAAKVESAGLREEYEELRTLYRDVQLRIRELEKQRPELRNGVDAEVLPRYEQILAKNSGTPLVAIEEDKCGECHLRLTPQTLNNARNGAIAFCDNCMHIIYQP